MYGTIFKRHFSEEEIVIIKDNREEFVEVVKQFVHPNSGWYSNDFDYYIDRFFNERIDACQL